jgi:hypothetical protein
MKRAPELLPLNLQLLILLFHQEAGPAAFRKPQHGEKPAKGVGSIHSRKGRISQRPVPGGGATKSGGAKPAIHASQRLLLRIRCSSWSAAHHGYGKLLAHPSIGAATSRPSTRISSIVMTRWVISPASASHSYPPKARRAAPLPFWVMQTSQLVSRASVRGAGGAPMQNV